MEEFALYDFIDRNADMPDGADFCLTLTDDAMEPFFPCGSAVYVSAKLSPGEFEAGIFCYAGKVYCRQWCEDFAGSLYLLPANPMQREKILTIPAEKREKCICLGRVLCKSPLPKPVYGQGSAAYAILL